MIVYLCILSFRHEFDSRLAGLGPHTTRATELSSMEEIWPSQVRDKVVVTDQSVLVRFLAKYIFQIIGQVMYGLCYELSRIEAPEFC